jgi:hypothetical protein
MRLPRLTALTALVYSCLSPPVHAADLSLTATPAWVSQYVFRGQKYAGSSLEPSVEADLGGGQLGIWSNFPLSGTAATNRSDPEADLYGSYAATLQPGLSIQPGFTAYFFPRPEAGFGTPDRQTFEPNLALNATAGPVRIVPKAYYDVTLRTFTGELSAALALPLRSIGTELDWAAQAGGYTSERGLNRHGGYWLVQAAVPYQLGAHLKVSASLAWTGGFDARRNETRALVAGFSAGTTF